MRAVDAHLVAVLGQENIHFKVLQGTMDINDIEDTSTLLANASSQMHHPTCLPDAYSHMPSPSMYQMHSPRCFLPDASSHAPPPRCLFPDAFSSPKRILPDASSHMHLFPPWCILPDASSQIQIPSTSHANKYNTSANQPTNKPVSPPTGHRRKTSVSTPVMVYQ